MGVFDFISKQFIDVIEWTESEDGVLSYKYPMQDNEIQNGAQLTVRDSQLALFVNEGRMADLFRPGLHKLSTQTLPILTNLMNWDKAFASPFKSDVFFYSTREQLGQKWGTPTPITVRDKEFGPIRIQAYGIYSYQLEDPKIFYQKVSGTREVYRTEDLDGQLRPAILTALSSFLATSNIPFVDMAANLVQFSSLLLEGLGAGFTNYGLTLKSFQVQSVSLPAELQKKLDERASMNIVGDLRSYTQFQAAQSIPIAAANEGGVAGAGAALGAGLGMAQAMSQAFSGAMGGGGSAVQGTADAAAALEKVHELFKKGILSQAEYDAKKAELLKKL
jgi:membrane protease subunit (stomatin/prohibitin family)